MLAIADKRTQVCQSNKSPMEPDLASVTRRNNELHILQIVSGQHINGALIYCKLLTDQLAKRGHRVSLLCRRDSWILSQTFEPGVELFESDLKRLPTTDLRQVAKWAREQNVDLFHTHMTRGHSFGVLLRMLTGIPVVATAHCTSFQLHWRFNDFVIANSEATENFQRRVNWVSASKMKTIYCCSELDRFQRVTPQRLLSAKRELGMRGDHLLLGIVGEVTSNKGHEYLFQTLPRIMTHSPDLKLAVLGSYGRRKPFTLKLRKMLLDHNLQNRVEWLGRRDNVEDFMTLFDLTVVPSIQESLGLVAIESLAAGTPVIAANTGGLPEIVRHEETGLLFPPEDSNALGDAIIRCLQDEPLRKRLAEAGRQHVLNRFSPPALVAQIEATYRQVCNRRRAA